MPSASREGRRFPLTMPALPLLLVAGFVACLVSAAAEPPKSKKSEPAKSARAPWTTSRVVGSPDPPPPFKVVRAFPNLKFEHPLLLARSPGSDRLFVGEQAGVLEIAAPQSFFDAAGASPQQNGSGDAPEPDARQKLALLSEAGVSLEVRLDGPLLAVADRIDGLNEPCIPSSWEHIRGSFTCW